MKAHFIRSVSLVLGLSIGLVGCTKQNKSTGAPKDSADIFSNRPIGAVPDLFVVTLNSPALLVAGTKVNGHWQIPGDAKQALLDEQTQLEQKIKAVAPEARVLYRYRMVLNGLAVYAPADAIPALRSLAGVKNVSPIRQMERAEILNETQPPVSKPNEVNSANFIGAEQAYALGFRGQGMRVGIIDTGVDYTHAMLGGSGNKADYAAIDPAQPSALFPNAKVVGGLDLVGTSFNAASPFTPDRLPHPDANPIDEAGHGTHVAGTVAGKGDGVNSYDGVAPDAQVYAVKVFGKTGSTMDASVIAGFEYAADPDGDLNPDDQLDVVNLSLGGGFGQPQILYTEAVRNLSRAGTVVVASAGNSGPVDYIVGAPGTSDEAISIAASIDGSEHNWKFAAVRFAMPSNPNWLAKATQGPISKPIAEISPTEGELVDIGLADVDLSDQVKKSLNGKVALIVRGKVPFAEKLKRAAGAGAIGAVVYNNDASNPIPMGGDPKDKVDIPAIMISQSLGLKLLEEMKTGPVRIQFKTGEVIEEPELIDTITSFSSKGPRSEDNLLKPEIAAPGQSVISAAMGQGIGTVQMDGTSMAAPHMSGVMALLKQARPTLSSAQLKSLAMQSAKILTAKTGEVPISLQGAGRVQIAEALAAPVVVEPASLSLGSVYLSTTSSQTKTLKLTNITKGDLSLDLSSTSSPGLTFSFSPSHVTVPASGSVEVKVTADYTLSDTANFASELDGRVLVKQNGKQVAQIPALAIRTLASMLTSSSTSAADGTVTLTNSSPVMGVALAFNLLGEDARKREPQASQTWKSRSCDLQSVGYRILTKATKKGPREVVQFAFKMYTPLTSWNACEVSVLIDADEDGIPDQELAGVSAAGIEGFQVAPFATALLDAPKARAIRLQYEKDLGEGTQSKLTYQPAMLAAGPMAPFAHSTLAVIEMPVDALAKTADGKLNVKVASLLQGGDAIEADDFLGDGLGGYQKLETTATALPYYNMTEMSTIDRSGGSITLNKGSGTGKLILYYPLNGFNSVRDAQSQIID